MAELQFSCPRCEHEVEEPYYGPCAACRLELRATIRGTARTVDGGAYEPKMNVVPNQIATKD